jgi:hypothetical protein
MNLPLTSHFDLEHQRATIRHSLRFLLGASLGPGLRADAWTPFEVFHHVLLVEASSADLLERLAAKHKDAAERNPAEPWPIRQELLDFPRDTAFSVPAFRGTEPKANVTLQALDALEESTWARHEALADLAQWKRFDDVSFPHPLAGKLNFYEWLAFGGIHERLHVVQLGRDIMSSRSFRG